MIRVEPLTFEEGTALAIQVTLPKTTLVAVAAATGYVMCGALDVGLLNTRLKDRAIIAGRAVGVKTVEELLAAPLDQVTEAAAAIGWLPGMTGRAAIAALLAHEKNAGPRTFG
ncbi:MAG: DUF1805 domain-containing protein [Kyrpidia sp.]|nr:DUF1805 domain-containing protein [Kyrpidia sp.]